MKINCEALGREALTRLRRTAGRPKEVQEGLLKTLLQKNKDTAYGKKYGFASIGGPKTYQDTVPVSCYEDYAPYILRMIQGKEQELTMEPAAYFCISSGTTGEPKYLPLTEDDLKLYQVYACGTVFGVAGEYYKDTPNIYGKVFQLGEFAKTYMPDGRLQGIRSASLYQWLDRDGQFDASGYCVPKEVLFPSRLEDLLYVKVRFALAQRDLCAIHGVFINRVIAVMDYIYQNWEMLLTDIATGRVSDAAGLDRRWAAYMEEKLPPNPRRAGELRSLSYGGLRQGMIRKLWPQLKYVQAIGGAAFSYYMKRYEEYAAGVPLHHFVYGATEGIFGVAGQMDAPDAYILFPEAGFFEFLPLDGAAPPRPLYLWELEQGRRYELLFTNHSGLYRYRMGDVVETTGWYGKLPLVRFCYRKNLVINIAGEKSNLEQLEEAVRRFAGQTGVLVNGYCVQEDVGGALPGYLFYMEVSGNMPCHAQEILEECLCAVNFEYQWCRNMNEIGPLCIKRLRAGSFARYEKHLEAQGVSLGQNKLLRILDTDEKKRFFDGNWADG